MSESSEDFRVGSISISPQHNTITKGDHVCRLQPKAMAVLHYLAKHSDRVINNDELLDQVWQGRVVTHSSIQKCINALRTAFTELDDSFEYIVYFSKRGYQLISPDNHTGLASTRNWFWKKSLLSVVILSFFISGAYFYYLYLPIIEQDEPVANVSTVNQFTQVKPYVSSTGRERIIEPHSSSERVAFIREELPEGLSDSKRSKESGLFIQATNGREWQVSIASGKFVDLAWSPSGRNLVAVERHTEREFVQYSKERINYYTFHIYTLDYKSEKVIEKNILSYWLGTVSSASWLNEGELEFVASQGDSFERVRYRYGIAYQNLSKVQSPKSEGQLLTSQYFNEKTAEHRSLSTGDEIRFLSKDQQVKGKWSIPFKVKSMSWMSNETGVLLLSGSNQLSILYTDGTLSAIDYSPKVSGRILRARSINKAKNIVLTVEAPVSLTKPLSPHLNNEKKDVNGVLWSDRFMHKGGGFIYTTTDSN